jgi:hypothetical protein
MGAFIAVLIAITNNLLQFDGNIKFMDTVSKQGHFERFAPFLTFDACEFFFS